MSILTRSLEDSSMAYSMLGGQQAMMSVEDTSMVQTKLQCCKPLSAILPESSKLVVLEVPFLGQKFKVSK